MHSRSEPVCVGLSEHESLRVEMNLRGSGGAVCARVCSNHGTGYRVVQDREKLPTTLETLPVNESDADVPHSNRDMQSILT